MSKNTRKQANLFDDLPLPEGQAPRIVGNRKDLDPQQRRFNDLMAQVEQLENDVQRWQERMEHLGRRLHAELLPLLDELWQVKKALALRLEETLTLPEEFGLDEASLDSLSAYA